MCKKIMVYLAVVLSASALSCLEDEDRPLSSNDGESPRAEIITPESDRIFPLGDPITFVGAGTDPQDGTLQGSALVWEIDKGVYLGTGDTVVTDTLSAGTHAVKLTVTDSDDKTGSDAVIFSVSEDAASLRNIWPNNDGNRWEYNYKRRLWDDPGESTSIPSWPTPEEVPPIPGMEEMEELLRSQPIGDNPRIETSTYKLEFAGDTTTMSGVTAQNLREIMPEIRSAQEASAEPGTIEVFLRRLCVARPDLEGKIRAKYPWIDIDTGSARDFSPAAILPELVEIIIRAPMLVHGYAWEKTNEWIGTYGDLDQDLAWKFLESNLNEGHEFTFQLIPSLASDVFLHCKVLRSLTAQTPAGSFENSIECLYAIDYGVFELRTIYIPSGLDRYSRTFDYGSVIYAPDVGPVYSYERLMLYPEEPPTIGLGDLEISLENSDIKYEYK